eukprot:jgi/Galph1/682/GphlegSOOS_G5304.1
MSGIDSRVVSLFHGLSLEQVYGKAKKIQEKALAKDFNYRCIETLRFLGLGLRENPFFERLQKEKDLRECHVLEVGCGFGVDGRDLLALGVKKENYWGIDVSDTFVDLGYELFEDRKELGSCFEVKNVMDEDFISVAKSKLPQVDIVVATLVLHVIPNDIKEFIHKTYQLLSPFKGVFIGETVGLDSDEEKPIYFERLGSPRYCYTKRSLEILLKEGGFRQVDIATLPKWSEGRRSIRAGSEQDEAKVRASGFLAFIAYA